MEKLITAFIDSKFVLFSGLDPDGFAKTYMSRLTDENGIIFTLSDERVSHEYWHFDETKTYENQVIYCSSLSGLQSFYEVLNSPSAETKNFIHAVLRCLDYAVETGLETSLCGAGGIFCRIEDGVTQVIFLPPELFEQSAMNTNPAKYSELQGKFIRKGLKGADAVRFTRSVIAYRALTGSMPYSENDTFKRQADYIDADFIPLELIINGIDPELASSIDAGLIIEPEFEPVPGEKRFQSKRDIKRRNLIHNEAEKYSTAKVMQELELSETGSRKPAADTNEFTLSRIRFLKSHARRIKINRFFRRNRNTIRTAAFAAVVVLYALNSWYSHLQEKATSLGLTSLETVQLMYSAIHNENDTVISEISRGDAMEEVDTKISAYYVMNRQREATNQDALTVSPAQWLFFTGGTTFWQYGLTNFKIDGQEYSTQMEVPTRKNHSEPVTKENGLLITKGTTRKHTADFYFVYYSGPVINVNRESDTLTLTYDGEKWLITDIKVNSMNRKTIKLQDFVNDYNTAVSAATGNVRNAVRFLRPKYEWLPDNTELKAGAAKMVQEFNNSAAERYLKTAE